MTVKPIVCVDFDGVLNDYHGYKGSDELYEPLTGAREFLQKLSEKYTIIILSARTPAKIYDWLIEHDLSKYVCDVTRVKPGAVAYIDDRSIKEVVYELNSLAEENEQLKDENKELKEINQDNQDFISSLEEEKINLQIKLQKIRDYAMEDGEVKQGVIEKVIWND